MKLYITLFFSCLVVLSFSQNNSKAARDKNSLSKQTVLGIQFSPVIPSNFIEKNDYTFQSDTANYSILFQPSYSYGVEIRHFFTYRFALSTGIIYTKRRIKTEFESHYPTESRGLDTTFSRELNFTAFELPLKATGYVRLSKQIYMSVGAGVCLNFYPSDILTDNVSFLRYGTLFSKVFQLGYTVNLGWELRSENSGTFYLGASYQTRLDDMGQVHFYEKGVELNHEPNYFQGRRGNYLSINLKYFFPINESKKR